MTPPGSASSSPSRLSSADPADPSSSQLPRASVTAGAPCAAQMGGSAACRPRLCRPNGPRGVLSWPWGDPAAYKWVTPVSTTLPLQTDTVFRRDETVSGGTVELGGGLGRLVLDKPPEQSSSRK